MNLTENILEKEIKLLVVEDSSLMRQIIEDSLMPYKNIKINTASNGKVALKKIEEFKPDVMTLDIQMDSMDGIQVLKEMRKNGINIPTITISKSSQPTIMESLRLGAIDFIEKPSSGIFSDIENLRKQLIEKINRAKMLSTLKREVKIEKVPKTNKLIIPKVIVIGASTGGPTSLYKIFSNLERIKTPIIVVQHMPDGFSESMAKRLNKISLIEVKVAEDNEQLKDYTAYVVPGDHHLEFDKDGKFILNKKPPVKGIRPSVDVTLKSALDVFGGRILSVILTGIGDDGAEGVELIAEKGGRCIVQNEETSVVFGMPRAIIEANNADSIVNIDRIHEEIVYYLENWD
ncbi:MAG: chemotaxis-specific protein-glutamate methyltransferase CheB [Candidatus Sericytochromatia bacterium]